MHTENRLCISCNSTIRGRTDKKFCNDHCRSAYNNLRNSSDSNYIRNINNALRRNRRMLETFLPPAATMVRIPRQQLYLKGFSFSYFTHTIAGKKGAVYYFCYDLGYLYLTPDRLLVVRKKETTLLP